MAKFNTMLKNASGRGMLNSQLASTMQGYKPAKARSTLNRACCNEGYEGFEGDSCGEFLEGSLRQALGSM